MVSDIQELRSADLQLPEIGEATGFLDDFEIPGAVDFSHWVDGQRAALLPLLHARLAQRIDQCRRMGDAKQMEAIAAQLRRLDPLSEEATRALIESRALAGDRIGSLRVFEAWRSKLAEELGAAPSLELDRLADRLRYSHPGSLVAPARKQEFSREGQNSFIGRSEEFSRCYATWQLAQSGSGQHVVVLGPRGIGKSTFISRVAASIGLEGAAILHTQCHELESSLGYGVLVDVVKQLIALPGSGGTDPTHLAELSTIVRTISSTWSTIPAPSAAAPAGAHVRLSEATVALLSSVAEERPLLVVVDDIHDADKPSLAVLFHVMRRIAHLPVLILSSVCTTTTGSSDIPVSMPHHGMSPGHTAITLMPFQDTDSQAFLDAVFADKPEPGTTIRRILLAGAQGNPMMMATLANHWHAFGLDALSLVPGVMRPSPQGHCEAARTPLPRVFTGLDSDSFAAVTLAAVLGPRMSDLRLYSVIALPPARIRHGIAVLTGRHILRGTSGRLEFADPNIRRDLYFSTPAPLRRSLHSAVAAVLSDSTDGEGPQDDLDVAWHLLRADRVTEAVPRLLRGAATAIQQGASHDADMALATGSYVLEGEARQSAMVLRAVALQELGRWNESLSIVASQCDGSGPVDAAMHDILRLHALRWEGLLTEAERRSGVHRMFALATSQHPTSLRASAVGALVRLLTLSRTPKDVAMLAEVVKDLRRLQCERYDTLHILLAEAWTLAASHQTEAALSRLREGVSVALEGGIRSTIAVRLLVGLGNTMAVLGRYEEAVKPLVDAETIARDLGNDTLVAECSTQLAVAFGRLGERVSQIDWARRAADRFPSQDQSAGAIGATYELGLGLALEGRCAEAKSVALDLLSGIEPVASPWIRQAGFLCAADILTLAGHPKRATRLARSALSSGRDRLLDQSYAGQYARWVAQMASEDGNPAFGLERLADEFPTLDCLHAKDRTELQAARAHLLQLIGTSATEEWTEVRLGLAELPPGISLTLKGLGLHPDQRLG